MPTSINRDIPVAIDPIALILPGKWYLIWLEIHHPRQPVTESLGKLFARMKPDDRSEVLQNARRLSSYCEVVEEAARHADRS
jgi:hypothetical protein